MRSLSALLRLLALMLMGVLAADCAMAADVPALPALGADAKQITVSGLSSGAFMATQFSVAYSARIAGVGIVAGGPFFCAGLGGLSGPEHFLVTATSECMNSPGPAPKGAAAWQAAQRFAKENEIDPVENITRQRVYIFTGAADSVVLSKVVAQTRAFYQDAGVPGQQIKYIDYVNAGHALLTANGKDAACSANAAPNLNNCGFIQSHDILRQLYGDLQPPSKKLSGELVDFDQTEFAKGGYTGLSDVGHMYVPAACRKESCRVHVVFHGCTQEDGRIGDRFYTTTGYNELADSNRIVVLYPQISADSTRNPNGCWDFWGYSSKDPMHPDFFAKTAPQMLAIDAMLTRLTSPRK
jgi:poly(3-hydroxybutyrate) depolymerase